VSEEDPRDPGIFEPPYPGHCLVHEHVAVAAEFGGGGPSRSSGRCDDSGLIGWGGPGEVVLAATARRRSASPYGQTRDLCLEAADHRRGHGDRGNVNKVEFRDGTTLLGQDTTAPTSSYGGNVPPEPTC
jgi:hypothetical protein